MSKTSGPRAQASKTSDWRPARAAQSLTTVVRRSDNETASSNVHTV
eukprot:CAMPEP_0172915492 /NCGR_PEP_ID=MMETSP1075-20121228/194416_1 /TAXON_ID=2916 /ORGANISM="Ceratium fusus, Strain PA161109" /LENGTH=45 /DNA_ID= /DNA_START= /DNA_END= /DNA_ORIENTATION=